MTENEKLASIIDDIELGRKIKNKEFENMPYEFPTNKLKEECKLEEACKQGEHSIGLDIKNKEIILKTCGKTYQGKAQDVINELEKSDLCPMMKNYMTGSVLTMSKSPNYNP